MRTASVARNLVLLAAVSFLGCSQSPGGTVGPTGSATPGGSSPSTTAPGTTSSVPPAAGPLHLTLGPDLCALLSAADFSAAGVGGAGAVKKNAYDNSFFCVFAGDSSASGGIELDMFIVADPSEVADYFSGVDPGGVFEQAEDVTATVPGADEALLATTSSSGPDFAQIGVRSGNFVFGLGVPPTGDWHGALIGLAGLILARAAAMAGGQASLPPQLELPDDLCDWVTADDLAPFADEPLTLKGEPEISGAVYFTGTQGTYLGKQVTCRFGYGSEPDTWMGGLIVDVGATPNDATLARKIYDEQVAYYADLAAGGGSNSYKVTPLTGIGEAAQKVKSFYTDDGSFISWTAEAIDNPVVVRLVLDSGFDRTKPDSDPALVTLLTKVVDQAIESITVP